MSVEAEATASARPGATAGAKLRAAREAAGLSVDAVAQQLKLAPRQVKAIEDDDWQHLPGRTFARGFARNYARFVHVDPEAVLALLPTSDAAPALERPTLAASPRPMGEIPVERVAKPSAARWLVPLLLVVIAVLAYYESSRLPFHLPKLPGQADTANAEKQVAPSTTIAPASAPSATPGTKTAALPNPVSGTPATVSDASNPPADARAGAVTVLQTPSAPDTNASTASAAPAGAALAETSLVLTFKGTSWAEVKDAKGRVVLQMTGGPGMTQTVSAMPPLELALGNAPQVDVTYRGQSVDLSSYTRGSVARVSLQ
jgi:cytoskeleton protein RodZ